MRQGSVIKKRERETERGQAGSRNTGKERTETTATKREKSE